MKITVLGCGASGGVPLITGNWGKCNPKNPKNRRRRSSILVQAEGKNILIDTGPDLREQLLDAGIRDIDCILYTHGHADHIGGIEDLRQLCLHNSRVIPAYADPETLKRLYKSYEYTLVTLDPLYPAFINGKLLETVSSFEGVPIIHFPQYHGNILSYGYQIRDFAYSTDLADMPEESYGLLKGLKMWFVGCLKETPHPGHAHLEHALAMIRKVNPRKAVLTHMSPHLDYDGLAARLPSHIEPAYDNMVISL